MDAAIKLDEKAHRKFKWENDKSSKAKGGTCNWSAEYIDETGASGKHCWNTLVKLKNGQYLSIKNMIMLAKICFRCFRGADC